MADALDMAIVDFQHKAAVLRAAIATSDHIRVTGAESAALVDAVADRLKTEGERELSPQEARAVQDLRDATEAASLAADAEISAREAWLAAKREYEKQVLAWAEVSLSNFQARWRRTRPSSEARRG